MDQTKPPKEEMTLEQFNEYKKITIESIDNQLPLLRKQIEYQQCATEMDELRARQLRAQQAIANIMAPPPAEIPEPSKEKERKLKVE